jgi:predicted metalloendopeptidase
MFDGARLHASELIVWELSAIGPIAQLWVQTPLEVIQAHALFHFVRLSAAVLPSAIDEANFDFYGRTLNGQPQPLERWQRGIQSVNAAMGEAIGEIYVQRHFPPEAKAQMLALVENMRRAYGERIRGLEWMSPAAKAAALDKLAKFRTKIGYPDVWRSYATLDIRSGDAFGNFLRANRWEWERNLARLDQPTDREEWGMTPQTVNAYYDATFNEIVFPAAILQAPIFDPNADPAVNYGAIGGVIGHEMGHGFDDQGARSDGDGILRQWWSDADIAAFGELVARLAAQYSRFEPLPGLHINGELTSGENIGDNGGLQVALHAYRLSLGGRPAPVLAGTTGEQRFFMSWAQHFRANQREEALRNQVLSQPHSPVKYRVNGAVRNMDAWYAAFDVRPSDALYLPEDQRVEIW